MLYRSLVLALVLAASVLAQGLVLHNGDRVVFYGDSITDQRQYTVFTETFLHTRYPALDISFVHSGWGGDRVTGGGGGPVDLRMKRDVAAYHPTMVTVMLGMNDGGYHAADKTTYQWYVTGFERLIGLLKQAAPGARITLIRPSPYDEVTRPPMKKGGYNPALVQFGDYLQEVAKREGFLIADLNGPLVKMLEKALWEDFEVAQRIIPDRVHPGDSGHLIMAGELLKAWGADGLVSKVEIDAAPETAKVVAAKAKIEGVKKGAGLEWDSTEESLPMPVNMSDAPTDLAVRSAGFNEQMNSETLAVAGLAAGNYALRIDGQQVKVFTAAELAKGINLAVLPTPMFKQAQAVHELVRKRADVHNIRWRTIEVPLAKDNLTQTSSAIAALDALDNEIAKKIAATAAPVAHHFELVPVPAEAASVPPGFTPIFNGKDLTGWHISQTNHHGATKEWTVENGVLSGAQDKAGHGGILVTDKSYKNYEIYLEANPDWGCDGGLFLRSTEAGEAYQVMIDYLEGGSVGGVYGEALKDGHIAVQVHMGNRWVAGGKHRFRNIAIRELP